MDGLASFDFFADETGIDEISWKTDEVKKVFNLQGQRLSLPSKGLHIVDGQKVWVK